LAKLANWDDKHRGKPIGEPEPFVVEAMTLLPRDGIALDVAAGRGRNAVTIARAGMQVVAADYSPVAMSTLAEAARSLHLPIWPVVTDFDTFAFRDNSFDAIIIVNFLDRSLFPHLLRAVKPAGFVVIETFLTDQAAIGHPKDPRFLLRRGELPELLVGMELKRHREGLIEYADGSRAWRAGAVARRRA